MGRKNAGHKHLQFKKKVKKKYLASEQSRQIVRRVSNVHAIVNDVGKHHL